MNVQHFLDRWSFWYPKSPPFRPSLRRNYPERWIRIHSLAAGKRFASDEAERSELLRRHNVSSVQVLGQGSDVAFVQAYGNGYRGQQEPAAVSSLGLIITDDISSPWKTDTDTIEYLGDEISFAFASSIWREGNYDDLIRAVADDAAAPLMFVNLDSGGIYSPYDGGADLFVCGEHIHSAIRKLLEPWLSERPDGL